MNLKRVLLFLVFFFSLFINVNAKEYMKDILIDDVSLEEFKSDVTVYDRDVSSGKENIKVTFLYDTSLYKGKGSYGDIKLDYGLNKVSFTLTSNEDVNDTVTYTLNITREDTRSKENSLSSLIVADKTVTLTDKLEYDVLVDNSLKTATIKAVRKSQNSWFVSGYGERLEGNAITLTGEKTTTEVKVEAENGDIKTYTINIIKKDYKSEDATLKSLTIDEIKFNFKSTTYEYNLSVLNEVESINLTAVSNDSKAVVDYLENVKLKVGVNNIVIKVLAEDEKTSKTYKLNITRNEKIHLVDDIKIKDIEFEFNPEIFDYEINSNLDTIDFQVTLTSEDATYEVLNNENLENGSVIKINVSSDKENLTYNFKIVNEESNLEVDDNNSKPTSDLKENNDFFKKYEMYIGLGVFGVGLLSLLLAIMKKFKNSQIM